MPPRRILITGAGGFIGAHLVRYLLDRTDWEIVALDSFTHRGKTDRLSLVHTHAHGTALRWHILVHDLRVPISNQLADQIGEIDYVVSLASSSHVDESIAHPRDFIANNVAVMLNLLEWAREAKPSIFLHQSTDEVYGPITTGAHKEGASHKPSSPYAASKSAQEQICWAYRRTYEVPVVVTNSMNIIGPYQGAEKFIPKVIRYVQQGKMLPIHSSPSLQSGTRFYLPAPDQCDALLFLLNSSELLLSQLGGNTDNGDMPRFNIMGNVELSNLELAQLIADILHERLTYELVDFHSSRPGHDLRYGLDGELLHSLGWQPKTDFHSYLEQTVNWYKENPAWLFP